MFVSCLLVLIGSSLLAVYFSTSLPQLLLILNHLHKIPTANTTKSRSQLTNYSQQLSPPPSHVSSKYSFSQSKGEFYNHQQKMDHFCWFFVFFSKKSFPSLFSRQEQHRGTAKKLERMPLICEAQDLEISPILDALPHYRGLNKH